MPVSLMGIGYNANDKYVNAVCIKETFACACWLLCDFNDQCEDNRYGYKARFFLIWSQFYFVIFFMSRADKKETIVL